MWYYIISTLDIGGSLINLFQYLAFTAIALLLPYAAIRVHLVHKSGNFILGADEMHEAAPRWGCLSYCLIIVSVPLAGFLAIAIVCKLMVMWK